jgi:putative flippase GtrA
MREISPFVYRVLRYGVVGVLVMGVFTGLNWLLGHRFGKDASFNLAYLPAVAMHFWLNKKWTFGRVGTNTKREVSEYLVMFVVTFIIQKIVFKEITASTDLPGWVAAGISNAAQTIITFLAMQFRIFRKQSEPIA